MDNLQWLRCYKCCGFKHILSVAQNADLDIGATIVKKTKENVLIVKTECWYRKNIQMILSVWRSKQRWRLSVKINIDQEFPK